MPRYRHRRPCLRVYWRISRVPWYSRRACPQTLIARVPDERVDSFKAALVMGESFMRDTKVTPLYLTAPL